MKEGFKHWVSVKLTNPVIDGTVTTVTGLTMPAFTAAGNITLGAYKIITTNYLLMELAGSGLKVRDSADTLYKNLYANQFLFGDALASFAATGYINAGNGDTNAISIQARDSGVGLVEIAAWIGAADPYWRFTRDCQFFPKGQPGAPLEGMVIYNSATHKLQVYTGAGWETIVSA